MQVIIIIGLENEKEQLQKDHQVDRTTTMSHLRVVRPPGMLLENHDLKVSYFRLMNGDWPSALC